MTPTELIAEARFRARKLLSGEWATHQDGVNCANDSITLCDALEEEISRRYQAESNYDHWKAQALKAESALEAAQDAQPWIPVAEPPKEDGEYWGFYSLGKVQFKARYRNGKWSVLSNEAYSALWVVTHWQPLPSPPKGED